VTLDFAAFEGSIARIQFLLTSNEQERQRYATEKLRILETMHSVRENTSELRTQLEEAQRVLAMRKSYDELAEKITSNRLLKPREDQQANLLKLQIEIADLEKESKDYAETWTERREQFGRIVEEGMQLRRLIRDEKEEVERREGMQEDQDGEDGDVGSKGKTSGPNSPRS
jgi:Tho complex subunit 7.